MPVSLTAIAEEARLADECGFDMLWTGDMQSTHRELYTSLMVLGGNTSKALIGPGVTNPVTRDPVVTASAVATLAEYTGGRAFLGIGAGDSALNNIGLRPARMRELEDYIVAVKNLLSTGTATFGDRELTLPWWKGKSPIPVLMSAHGPKSLEMAGRIADGVIVGTGLTADAVDNALSHISRGAATSGRSL